MANVGQIFYQVFPTEESSPQIKLDIVPDGTKRAASLPSRSAAIFSRAVRK